MKLLQTMLSALVAVVVLNKVTALPQVTTGLPFFPGGETDDDLDDFYDSDDERAVSGVVVGTGPAGEPTYVITLHDDDDSDDDDWDDRPITVTYVGDASRATAYVSYTDDDLDSLYGDDNDTDHNRGDDTDSVNGDDDSDDTDDDDDGFHTHAIECDIQNETAVCTYANIGVVNNQTTTSFVATRTRTARPITLIATTGTVPPASSPTTTGTTTGTGSSATGTGTADTQLSGAQENIAAGAVAAGLSAAVAAYMMA